MDYYYSYPAHAMAEERMRMPMHPAESQARANNTSSTLLQLSRLHTMPPSHVEQQKITHESKPRLSKDQQDVLERHFQAQPKPSTTIKRGFAENLGVPLDKINNWFQNRRAKVKQDAKKQQGPPSSGAHHLSQPFEHQSSAEPAPIDADFFDSSFDTTPQQLSIAPFMGAPTMVEPRSRDESPESSNFTFTNSDFIINDSDAFRNFFGLDDGLVGTNPTTSYDAISAFGKQFGEPLYSFETANMHEFTNRPTTAFLHNGHDNSFGFHDGTTVEDMYGRVPSFSVEGTSSAASAQLSSADSRNSSPNWTTSNRIEDQIVQIPQQRQGQLALHRMAQLPLRTAPSAAAGLSMAGRPAQTQFSQSAGVNPTNASTEMNGNEADHVELQQHASVSWKRPSATSSLASRRQRRPAALSNLRSNSFQGVSPASPSSATTPDQGLRRIKSSVGLINGRVHKTSNPSLQKSPLSLTFADDEAISHHKLARQKSSLANLRGTPSSNGKTVAPPSPSSPFHVNSSPEGHGSLWTPLHPSLDESAWCSSPTAAGHGQAAPYASPPGTPFDSLHKLVNIPSPFGVSPTGRSFGGPSATGTLTSGPTSLATTPLASPPAQQHQQQYLSQPAVPAPQWLQVLGPHAPSQQQQPMVYADPRMMNPNFAMGPPGHPQQQTTMVPRHGYPVAYQLQPAAYSVPMPMNMPMSVPLGFDYPFPPATTEYMHHPQQQQQRYIPYLNTNSNSNTGANITSGGAIAKPPQELEIHEYSPREPADPSVMPPKGAGKVGGQQQPRNYIFTNQGPEHFGSP